MEMENNCIFAKMLTNTCTKWDVFLFLGVTGAPQNLFLLVCVFYR